MALGGRELLLVVRAQNQASGALKKVANDMRRLGAMDDMQMRRNRLLQQQSKLMTQQMGRQNELQSVTSGQRHQAAQMRRVALNHQEANSNAALSYIG